jgi:ATP-binding cassette subfamily B protein
MAPRPEDTRLGLREIARMLWLEATPFVKARLVAVMGLVTAASVLTALSPVALKLIVDRLTGESKTRFDPPLLLGALYILSIWLARITNELRELVFARVRQRIFRTLSERLFWHLMHLSLRFHVNRQTGAVTQTLDNGLEGLRIILQQLVFTYLPVSVELSTVLLILVRLVSPPFLLLFGGAVVCYMATFSYCASTITRTARRAAAARVEAAAGMTDGLLNYETIKYFTAESLVQARVAKALERCEFEWVGFYRRYAINGLFAAVVFVTFLGGTVCYAMREVQQGRMTLGNFVLVNAYMLQVVRPVEMMGYAMQALSSAVAMLEKLLQVFREAAEPGPGLGHEPAAGPGFLEFHEVDLSYGVGRPVLKNASFRVPAGHTVGIVGPSGSGKSTIVRLLMRLLDPEGGRILLDDVPISGMALRDLRQLIAVVPQDTVLFEDTVRYNIAFGRAEASFEDIQDAARVAQLHEFVMTLPDGYDTVVGERGSKLSGGERQRISIARAVLKAPRIYVFDEATSSLDSGTERRILRSLRSLSRSKTTLVIAHRLSTVVHADEILVLENGEITERGTHQSLLRRNGRYAALWKAQQEQSAAAPGEHDEPSYDVKSPRSA